MAIGLTGFSVPLLPKPLTAVEPMPEFLYVANILHSSQHIRWIEDSLPDLVEIREIQGAYDFVLASAVWHHIDEIERSVAMSHIAKLLCVGGIFAARAGRGWNAHLPNGCVQNY